MILKLGGKKTTKRIRWENISPYLKKETTKYIPLDHTKSHYLSLLPRAKQHTRSRLSSTLSLALTLFSFSFIHRAKGLYTWCPMFPGSHSTIGNDISIKKKKDKILLLEEDTIILEDMLWKKDHTPNERGTLWRVLELCQTSVNSNTCYKVSQNLVLTKAVISKTTLTGTMNSVNTVNGHRV